MRKILQFIAVVALCGCAFAPSPDRKTNASEMPHRIQYIIIHTTLLDFEKSLKVLSQGGVSSHYLISDHTRPVIYGLVDDSRNAWHAGLSSWGDHRMLNESSIGIELVHPGFDNTESGRVWKPFTQAQIDKLITLVAHLKEKYGIRPDRILSHGQIAPSRRQDPGPTFPWHQFAKAKLIIWPDPQDVALSMRTFNTDLPDIDWFQKHLAKFGLDVHPSGVYDSATKDALIAFQIKYRPRDFSGIADAETAAMLVSLLKACAEIEKDNKIVPESI